MGKLLTVIHNVYKRNDLMVKALKNNLTALDNTEIDYQFIIFNDAGDKAIKDDLVGILRRYHNTEYIYDETGHGQKVQTGGWIGAQEYVQGHYIHNACHNDFYTPYFYKMATDFLTMNPHIALFFSNCYHVDEDFHTMHVPLPIEEDKYFGDKWQDPEQMFKHWFGISGDMGQVTRANNFVYAPGTIYRADVHNKIGIPNITKFGGAADFEFWARMLFNNYRFFYYHFPLWYYVRSYDSLSHDEYAVTERDTKHMPNIKKKYSELWAENGFSINTEEKGLGVE